MNNRKPAIKHGSTDILFNIFYANRKTMEIAVHPDESVVITSPAGTDFEEIIRRLNKRARWIKKQQAYFRQFTPRTPPRKYLGGESHLYLGRQYRLRIRSGKFNEMKLTRGFFQITCKRELSREKVRGQLEAWYLDKAREKFSERLEFCVLKFKRKGIPYPKLSIRKMRTRWGSLSALGTLTLNLDLIRAPKECIDYVITHELCHVKHQEHGPKFYRLLEKVMPDWEKRKHKLELALV